MQPRPSPSPGRRRGAPRHRQGERRGSLVVVGIGLMLGRHVTVETVDAIRGAEHVFHLVTNPAAEAWVERLNSRTTALGDCFREGKRRGRSYSEMAQRIVDAVRGGEQVCAVFYGHPGVLVSPAHQALVRARRAGYPARMLPGISAEDCLFADLAIDPRGLGWQSFEASVKPRMQARPERLRVLADRLAPHYPARHSAILYEAPEFPISDPLIGRVPLRRLAEKPFYPKTTLYVPPRPTTSYDARVARWFTSK